MSEIEILELVTASATLRFDVVDVDGLVAKLARATEEPQINGLVADMATEVASSADSLEIPIPRMGPTYAYE